MHRVITNAAHGEVVDHIDGDGLNNQRGNLRICNWSVNNLNSITKGRLSRYRGVTFVHRRKTTPWAAYVSCERKNVWLGFFASEEDAARAYDRVALSLYGKCVRLNFPQEEAPPYPEDANARDRQSRARASL